MVSLRCRLAAGRGAGGGGGFPAALPGPGRHAGAPGVDRGHHSLAFVVSTLMAPKTRAYVFLKLSRPKREVNAFVSRAGFGGCLRGLNVREL